MKLGVAAAALLCLPGAARAAAQTPSSPAAMYKEWCAVCHGEDGRGRPPDRPVKTDPIDLTDCRLTTPETDADWELVIAQGGPAAGRSSDMPAFEVLDRAAIRELVRFTKQFCAEPRWPQGHLNYPRAIFTTKAFPENEAMLLPVVTHGRETTVRTRLDVSYARRVGRRAEVGVGVPAETVGWVTGPVAGVGDIRLEGKYVPFASATTPRIVSVGLEATLPTGSRRWGFGEGAAVFEPFVAAGAMWRGSFVQADVRGLMPTRRFRTEPIRYVPYGVALLRPLSVSPTTWTLGAEVVGTDLNVSIALEIQKGLTRTGSLTAAFGVRLSLTSPRPFKHDVTRWSGYLLWDFMEPLRARP